MARCAGSNISGNDTIAIFGQGPVGLSATQLAAAMGARVIALDVSPERLDRAKEFGACRNRQSALQRSGRRDQGPDAWLRRRIHPRHIEPARGPHRRGAQPPRCGARRCFVGERNKVTIDVSPDMLRKQLTIVASWTFSQMGQAECAQLRRRPQGRRRPPLHPPMEARPGRGGLPPVRHPDYRQGRVPDVRAAHPPSPDGVPRPALSLATRAERSGRGDLRRYGTVPHAGVGSASEHTFACVGTASSAPSDPPVSPALLCGRDQASLFSSGSPHQPGDADRSASSACHYRRDRVADRRRSATPATSLHRSDAGEGAERLRGG